MLDLLIALRFKQLIGHNLHNFINGAQFFADHEFLGTFYKQAEDQYDQVIERMIGLGLDFNPNDVQKDSVEHFNSVKFPYSSPFKIIESIEEEIYELIEEIIKKETLTQGTIQMLGNIADQCEINLYKIKQRLKS